MKGNFLILKKQVDFNRVYNKGIAIKNQFFVLIYIKNQLSYTRVGYVASKKVGNSVKRNRARRLMRAAFYNLETRIKIGYDLVFVARKSILETNSNILCAEIKNIISKL